MLRWALVAATILLLVPTPAQAQSESDEGQENPCDSPTSDGQDGSDADRDTDKPTAEPRASTLPKPTAEATEHTERALLEARLKELEASQALMAEQLQQLQQPPESSSSNVPSMELSFGGSIWTDLRWRVQEKAIGPWFDRRTLPIGLSRTETISKFKLKAKMGRFAGVADIDLVFTGVPNAPDSVTALSDRSVVEPFRIEAHAAYIQAKGVLRGLDMRFGIQKVMWGVGDQFNPTNNLNADDVEDPLLFGEQQGNLMFKMDYSPTWWLTFSGVLVPIFRPALVPASGELALAAIDRLPFNDPDMRYRIHSSTQMALEVLGNGTVANNIVPVLPELHPKNMQFAFRVGGNLGGQDLAISYYRGFEDFPVPTLNLSSLSDEGPYCENDPAYPNVRTEPANPDEEECINRYILTDATLQYPRIHVLGFNWAGEIPNAIGYRLELGVYFPERMDIGVFTPAIPPFQAEGELDYDEDGEAGGTRPEVLSKKPYAKWTLGIDYTIGPVMLNAQWVHGMVDESGAGGWMHPNLDGRAVRLGEATAPQTGALLLDCAINGRGEECAREITRPKLADYFVFGVDVNFLRNAALFRLFTLWDLSGYTETKWNVNQAKRVSNYFGPFSADGFSAVIYPEFRYNFGYGFELHAGALIQLGKNYTKFGDPAAGGSQVFIRGKFSY